MLKKHIKNLILILLLAALTAAAAAPLRHPKQTAADWMSRLDNGRSIASLSIPGTHDSGAMYSFAGLFGKCQTLSVPQQLEAGVRYLDLRLRLVDDELRVYHNFVEQKTDFPALLEQLVSFLQENPSEFLLVVLKEEDDPIRSEKQFSQALEALLRQYPQIISTADTLPETVGSARGKLYVLSRYENATLGIPCDTGWVNNSSFVLGDMYVQDRYKLSSTEEKLPELTAALAAAASGEYSLVLNHSSCYLSGSFPPSYAGTPAHTVNPWLRRYLAENPGCVGVLICDFMTSELSMDILGRNFV